MISLPTKLLRQVMTKSVRLHVDELDQIFYQTEPTRKVNTVKTLGIKLAQFFIFSFQALIKEKFPKNTAKTFFGIAKLFNFLG